MPVSTARAIAFDVLTRVEADGAYAADTLHEFLSRGWPSRPERPRDHKRRGQTNATARRVQRSDAALATELVHGVLRWQRLLDYLVERQAKRPAESLDPEVRRALRLGAYQLLFLNRIPPSAAVNESVEIIKRAGKRSASTLVNAVLRRMPRGPFHPTVFAPTLPAEIPEDERLAIAYSHPTWLVARWLSAFGAERTLSLLEADNRPLPLACAVLDPACPDHVAASLRADGLEIEPGRLLKTSLVVRGGNLADTAAFREGQILVQDEASQAVALLLGVGKGQRVLDLCAAPGNKTLLLARAAGPEATVVAADIHGHRLRAVAAQFRRARTAAVDLVALDATRPLPFARRFDRILVDAPCSGTGTLSRNPEIRWRLRPEDIGDLAARQALILGHALDALASGGRLVYATCSLEPEENEKIVRSILEKRNQIGLGRDRAALIAKLASSVAVDRLFDRDGFFRILPSETSTDGFFAAILERN